VLWDPLVRHYSIIFWSLCVWACSLHMHAITHSWEWKPAFLCAPWLIYMCNMPHLHVPHDSIIRVTGHIYTCDMTHFNCNMTHLYVRYHTCALARACTRRRAKECTCACIWKQTSATDRVTPANTRERQSNTQTHTHIHKQTHSHTWTRARRTQRMSCSSSILAALGVTVRALSKCVSYR